MQVGDLVRYKGVSRTSIKRGTIAYVVSMHEGNTLDFCMVKVLTTGGVARAFERDLDVYESKNQTESR